MRITRELVYYHTSSLSRSVTESGSNDRLSRHDAVSDDQCIYSVKRICLIYDGIESTSSLRNVSVLSSQFSVLGSRFSGSNGQSSSKRRKAIGGGGWIGSEVGLNGRDISYRMHSHQRCIKALVTSPSVHASCSPSHCKDDDSIGLN